MTAGLFLLLAGLCLLSGSAFAAFCWAARHGQFQRLEESAREIFDEDEPVGRPTDHFPDRHA